MPVRTSAVPVAVTLWKAAPAKFTEADVPLVSVEWESSTFGVESLPEVPTPIVPMVPVAAIIPPPAFAVEPVPTASTPAALREMVTSSEELMRIRPVEL